MSEPNWIVRKFPTASARQRPWVVEDVPDVNGKFVGQIIAQPTTNPNWEKIAPVIAAAPELLAEAKAIIDRHDAKARACNFSACGCDDCTPFRAALKKAAGE